MRYFRVPKPVVVDRTKQRWQPVGAYFTMSVQEDNDLAPRLLRTPHPRTDEALALCVADQPHFAVELADVVLQLVLQIFCTKWSFRELSEELKKYYPCHCSHRRAKLPPGTAEVCG